MLAVRHDRSTTRVAFDGLRVCGRCSFSVMKDLIKSSLRTFAWIRVLLLFAAVGFLYLIITSSQHRECTVL